jgi:DNA-binding transcriptional regulator YiaG
MNMDMLASPHTFLRVSAGTWRRRNRCHLRSRPSGLLQHSMAKKSQNRTYSLTPTAPHEDDMNRSASRPGAIGGAVIKAARRSVKLSRRELARALGVGPRTINAWETGSVPLYCVPYGVLLELSQALERARAQGASLTESLLASQCDLLIATTLAGIEDYAKSRRSTQTPRVSTRETCCAGR